MRILMLSHGSGGGADLALKEAAVFLTAKNHEVIILVGQEGVGNFTDVFSIVHKVVTCENLVWWVIPLENEIDQPSLFNEKTIEIVNLISNLNPDLIWTNTGVIPQGALAAKLLGIPHIWFLHEFLDIDHGFKLPFAREIFGSFVSEFSQLVLTCSNAVATHFSLNMNPKVKTFYFPPNQYRDMQGFNKIRTDGTFDILSIGSISPSKGQIDLVRAMSILYSKGANINCKIVGRGNAEYVNYLKREIETLSLSKHIQIFEDIDDLVKEQYISESNLVVVTSKNEAFGRVPFEAAHYAVPIIFPMSGGITEYMRDGINGLGYIPGDYDSLAERIEFVRDHPENANIIAQKAHGDLEKFSHDNRIDLLLEHIHDDYHPAPNLFSEILRQSLSDVVTIERLRLETEEALRSIVNSNIWKVLAPYRKFKEVAMGMRIFKGKN